eukprot:985059-Rhodomonas_salina.1
MGCEKETKELATPANNRRPASGTRLPRVTVILRETYRSQPRVPVNFNPVSAMFQLVSFHANLAVEPFFPRCAVGGGLGCAGV